LTICAPKPVGPTGLIIDEAHHIFSEENSASNPLLPRLWPFLSRPMFGELLAAKQR
jgi:hypothetical protein